MENGNVIEVKNISKSFKIYYDKGHTIKDYVATGKRGRHEIRQVLKDVSFSLKKGEAIGLIGHNGCGKSTTLKLLTRIIYPDSGSIEMKGRVSSLLELGAGFHPDMSGRENIYINASIFGLTKKEIDERLEDIIAFSELEEFIDNPVRTYSSGMYMRLAFAVAINVEADILLIDEILAVGDANFQSKCFNKMRDLKADGVTIVLVTHDTNTVERFCDKAIWLNDGVIQKQGKSIEVVDKYLEFMNEEKLSQLEKEEKRRREKEKKRLAEEKKVQIERKKQEEMEAAKTPEEKAWEQATDMSVKRFGTRDAVITDVKLLNHKKEDTRILHAGGDYYIVYQYETNKPNKEYIFGMGIYTLDGVCLFGTNTLIGKQHVPPVEKNGELTFCGKNLSLLSGKYILQVAIADLDGTPVDFIREYCRFDVINGNRDAGFCYMENDWIIDK
ncbi:MAG: ABC transporter ATP-binding protein [Clostridium sp.]|nr:ABC transporter ATP-binding protein [Clostridium sp.]